MSRVLLASYDGVVDGPGRSQTLPYLRGLAARGHAMALFSYEREDVVDDDEATSEVDRELDGAPWTRVPWRRSPLRDLASGMLALRRAAQAHQAGFIHARGYVPAFLARRLGLPFLFDMRGFWPDERADGGLWTRDSFGYRLWKRIERDLCAKARAIVVLTERARAALRQLAMVPAETPISVIPTCADLDRFRPIAAEERPPECRDGVRYLVFGSTGTWYLREEMLDFATFALRLDPRAVLHLLTRDPPGPLAEGLARRGVGRDRYVLRPVPPNDAPRWISGARAAILLVRPTWSKGASCPTKLAELLGCGVPVLMNEGVGDADRLLAEGEAGAAVKRLDEAGYAAALDSLERLWARGDTVNRCRVVAEREFSLPVGVARYDELYAEIARG